MLSKKEGYIQGILSIITCVFAILALIPILQFLYEPNDVGGFIRTLVLPAVLWNLALVIIAILSFLRYRFSSILVILLSWHFVADAWSGLYYYVVKPSKVINAGLVNYFSVIAYVAELALVAIAIYILLKSLVRNKHVV